MSNLWKQFQKLLPDNRILVGDVISHHGDQTSTVEFVGGERIRPMGQGAAVGKKALVQGDRVIGEAPDLPQYNITIQ